MAEELETADVVVIGAGLSGLVNAILLAETGRSVVVLEQHAIPGGYLQQFSRKRTTFDVGFHYLGQTMPGRPLRRMLEHLRVWDHLNVVALPENDAITVRQGEHAFGYPSTFDRFVEKAIATWPHERQAIERFANETDAVCRGFKWFALDKSAGHAPPEGIEAEGASFATYASTRLTDPWLTQVLAFQSFNLGLYPHEIPWVKHLLAMRANFDATSRIVGGGGALVDALVARATELGVRFRFKTNVKKFVCDGREAREVVADHGARFAADLFIAACHPKVVMNCIDDADIRPVFKERILQMRDSRGALQVFLRLRAPLRSLKACCTMLHDPAEGEKVPALSVVLVVNPLPEEVADSTSPRLEAMTYIDHAIFARWATLPVMRRGAEYEAFKRQLADRVIAMITTVAPELPELITDVYVSTPLSDEFYTRNSHGGVFGISHEVGQEGLRRPQPRTRLRNLVFTGHSIHMPGICGVIINAFDSSDTIRGDGTLFDAVASR